MHYSFLVIDNSRIENSMTDPHVGKYLYLSCDAANGSVKWYHKSRSSEPIHFETELFIPKIDFSQGGNYWCYGMYNTSVSKHFLAETLIQVYGKLCTHR